MTVPMAPEIDTEQEVILLKIERINENQIRCTLTSFDLSVRNLNLVELAYGTEKARKLFREMIQKASNEVGFEADDIPLMVEAIPLSGESIMLVITKIEDPEELDTRFAKFSPPSDEDTESLLSKLAGQLLEGAGIWTIQNQLQCRLPERACRPANRRQRFRGRPGTPTLPGFSVSRIWTGSAKRPGPWADSTPASTPSLKSPAPASITW